MKFNQKSNLFFDSECGNYTISKIKLKESKTFEYNAFYRQTNNIGGPFKSSTAAVECCKDHKRRATA